MRLTTWLASLLAELWTARRRRCQHTWTLLADPPAWVRCGRTASQ